MSSTKGALTRTYWPFLRFERSSIHKPDRATVASAVIRLGKSHTRPVSANALAQPRICRSEAEANRSVAAPRLGDTCSPALEKVNLVGR